VRENADDSTRDAKSSRSPPELRRRRSSPPKISPALQRLGGMTPPLGISQEIGDEDTA